MVQDQDLMESRAQSHAVHEGQLPDRFESLDALHAVHVRLLRAYRERLAGSDLDQGDEEAVVERLQDSQVVNDVLQFVDAAQRTGVVIDDPVDRDAAQSILDYWTTSRIEHSGLQARRALAPVDPARWPVLPDSDCPFLGLNAFSECDAGRFFGRGRLLTNLLQRVRERSLVIVVGTSGSGKSSLVLAGLIPALRAGALEGSADWRYLPPIVPGSDPLTVLARMVRGDVRGSVAEAESDRLVDDPAHVPDTLRCLGRPCVLVVDQFEEVFTLGDSLSQESATEFIDILLRVAGDIRAGHRVVLTMRIDFQQKIAIHPGLNEAYAEGNFPMLAMQEDELRDAIEKPAANAKLRFEPGVVNDLVKSVLGEEAALPLLQFTLLELWHARLHDRITMAGLRHLGGPKLALAKAADEYFGKLMIEEKDECQRIFLLLTARSSDLEVFRRRVPRSQLYAAGAARERTDRVLEGLAQRRLVRVMSGPGLTEDDDLVEVAHETLVRNWPLLLGWLADSRLQRQKRDLFASVAQEYADAPDPSRLLVGFALEEALALYESDPGLSGSEVDFLMKSKKRRDEKRDAKLEVTRQMIAAAERQKRAWAMTAGVFALLLLGLAGSGWQAWRQSRLASIETARAASAAADSLIASTNAIALNEVAKALKAARAAEIATAVEMQRSEMAGALAVNSLKAAALAREQSSEIARKNHEMATRALAGWAQQLSGEDPVLAILLAWEAYGREKTPETVRMLYATLGPSVTHARIAKEKSAEVVRTLALNSSGNRLATGGVINRQALAREGELELDLSDAAAKTSKSVTVIREWTRSASGEFVLSHSHVGPDMPTSSLYSPDDTMLAMGFGTQSPFGTTNGSLPRTGGEIRVWGTGKHLLLERSTGAVTALAFSADSTELAVASVVLDGENEATHQIEIFQLMRNPAERRVVSVDAETIDLRFADGTGTLIVASKNGKVTRMKFADSGELIARQPVDVSCGGQPTVALAEGRVLSTQAAISCLEPVADGKNDATIDSRPFSEAVVSPSGSHVARLSRNSREIVITDADRGTSLTLRAAFDLQSQMNYRQLVRFSGDSSVLAIQRDGGAIDIYRLDGADTLLMKALPGRVEFAPAENLIVLNRKADRQLDFLDPTTGRKLLPPLPWDDLWMDVSLIKFTRADEIQAVVRLAGPRARRAAQRIELGASVQVMETKDGVSTINVNAMTATRLVYKHPADAIWNTCELLDLRSGAQLASSEAACPTIDVRGKFIAVQSRDEHGTPRVNVFTRDGDRALPLRTLPPQKHLSIVQFSGPEGTLLIGDGWRAIEAWNVRAPADQPLARIELAYSLGAKTAGNGRFLVARPIPPDTEFPIRSANFSVWDLASGIQITSGIQSTSTTGAYLTRELASGLESEVLDATWTRRVLVPGRPDFRFSSDESLVAAVYGGENRAVVYALASGEIVADVSYDGLSGVQFSPSNRYLLVEAGPGSILVPLVRSDLAKLVDEQTKGRQLTAAERCRFINDQDAVKCPAASTNVSTSRRP